MIEVGSSVYWLTYELENIFLSHVKHKSFSLRNCISVGDNFLRWLGFGGVGKRGELMLDVEGDMNGFSWLWDEENIGW